MTTFIQPEWVPERNADGTPRITTDEDGTRYVHWVRSDGISRIIAKVEDQP